MGCEEEHGDVTVPGWCDQQLVDLGVHILCHQVIVGIDFIQFTVRPGNGGQNILHQFHIAPVPADHSPGERGFREQHRPVIGFHGHCGFREDLSVRQVYLQRGFARIAARQFTVLADGKNLCIAAQPLQGSSRFHEFRTGPDLHLRSVIDHDTLVIRNKDIIVFRFGSRLGIVSRNDARKLPGICETFVHLFPGHFLLQFSLPELKPGGFRFPAQVQPVQYFDKSLVVQVFVVHFIGEHESRRNLGERHVFPCQLVAPELQAVGVRFPAQRLPVAPGHKGRYSLAVGHRGSCRSFRKRSRLYAIAFTDAFEFSGSAKPVQQFVQGSSAGNQVTPALPAGFIRRPVQHRPVQDLNHFLRRLMHLDKLPAAEEAQDNFRGRSVFAFQSAGPVGQSALIRFPSKDQPVAAGHKGFHPVVFFRSPG